MIQKLPRVDIVIVGDLNKLTKDCIESIRETTELFNVIVEPYNGYNRSLNEGAKKGDSEYIAFCNNDLIFTEGWLQPLISSLSVYNSVSAWCPKTHHQWWNSKVPEQPYKSFEIGKSIARWFIMMKRKTWEKIGGFDERFEFWYADNAYGEQLKKHHLTHALIPQSKVIHLQSQTINKVSNSEKRRLTTKQSQVFKKHYGRNKRR